MGPNGAGKSTLAQVLAGRDGYDVTGTVTFDGVDLLALTPEERAAAGLFLAFQYPIEIPGVGNMYFLRTARERRATPSAACPSSTPSTFLALAKEHMDRLDMDPAFLSRSVNAGFSGGEKKRNEILQMSMLEPRLAILDETDSGLDIDALRVVAEGVERLRSPDRAMLIITHYPRLLELRPTRPGPRAQRRAHRPLRRPRARLELEADGYGDGPTPGAMTATDPIVRAGRRRRRRAPADTGLVGGHGSRRPGTRRGGTPRSTRSSPALEAAPADSGRGRTPVDRSGRRRARRRPRRPAPRVRQRRLRAGSVRRPTDSRPACSVRARRSAHGRCRSDARAAGDDPRRRVRRPQPRRRPRRRGRRRRRPACDSTRRSTSSTSPHPATLRTDGRIHAPARSSTSGATATLHVIETYAGSPAPR